MSLASPSVIIVLLLGIVLGAINGGLVVVTKVPDIVVTLSTSFDLCRLRPAGHAPSCRGAASWLKGLVVGPALHDGPEAFIVLIVIVAVIWIPLKRSKLGLSLYAIGSNRLAAFRSGIAVDRTKFLSYVITGFIGSIRRAVAGCQHRHRHAGPGSDVRADRNRRGRPRRRQPRRRYRRRQSAPSSRSSCFN